MTVDEFLVIGELIYFVDLALYKNKEQSRVWKFFFIMQSCHSLRDDFSFINFGPSSEQTNLEPDTTFKEVLDSGNYYRPSWDQQLNAIKELVVDTDSSLLPKLVPKCIGRRSKPASIFQQLKDLYHEEIQQSNLSEVPDTRQTSYLLDKLVKRRRFNMVILTLFPITEGYSLSFSSIEGEKIEESKQPYTKDVLLDYIDREQLPTPYLEYWENSFPQLFYDGCVIAQVRDLRHGLPAQVRHVLLKPHTQSLISDVNKLLMDRNRLWTLEEQFSVECNVINNASRTLCLDPSPEAGKRMLKLHQDLHAFDTNSIRNLLYRNSQLVQHRKRKYEHLLPRSNRFLSDFIANKKAAPSTSNAPNSFVPDSEIKGVHVPYQKFPLVEDIFHEVSSLAKPPNYQKQQESCDFTPDLIEEWLPESGISLDTNCHIKLKV